MLVSLKERLNEASILDLLAAADAELKETQQFVRDYSRDEQFRLVGWEEDGDIVALAGYERLPGGVVKVHHLAVEPEERGMGYGRGILLHVMEQERPRLVTVETDEESVDFFRNVGFTVQSIPAQWGLERYRCTFETEF